MTDEKRQGILESLLGKAKADETRDDLKKAQELLDNAGVERKARESKSITIKEVDLMTAAETIAGAILKALEQHGITLAAAESSESDVQTPEEVNEIAIEATMDAVEELAEGEKQDDEEKEEEMEEEEDEATKSLRELVAANTATVKSLAEYVATSLEDQGDMSKAIVTMAEVLPTVVERLQALEDAYGHRPRQASKANETAFESEEIEAEAKKSLEGESAFLGLRVKAQPE